MFLWGWKIKTVNVDLGTDPFVPFASFLSYFATFQLEKDVKKGEIYEVKGIDIKNVRNLKFKVSEVGENYFLNPTVK